MDDATLTTLSNGQQELRWGSFDIEDIEFTAGSLQEFSVQIILDKQVQITDTTVSASNMAVRMTLITDGDMGQSGSNGRGLLFANSPVFNRVPGGSGGENGSEVSMGLSSTSNSTWNLATIDVTDTIFRNNTFFANAVSAISARELTLKADEIVISPLPLANINMVATEGSGDVVITASGSIDLTGLTLTGTVNLTGTVSPNTGEVWVGASQGTTYAGFSPAPAPFGSGSSTQIPSGGGAAF